MIDIKIIKGTILQTNNYIVSDNENVVLIESSAKVEEIKKDIQGKFVEAVLLTHGHWDHFLYIEKYLQEFDCKVYMTKESFKKLNEKSKTFSADRRIALEIDDEKVIFVKDGDILNFGKSLHFKIIETCGHTDCSVSYLLNDKYLFSGDTLFKRDVGRWDLPTGSLEVLKKSLQKLMRLDSEIVVYPGHGDATTVGEEKDFLEEGYPD